MSVVAPADVDLRRADRIALFTVAATAPVLVAVAWWGARIVEADPRIHVQAAPFVGTWQAVPLTLRHLPAVALALSVALAGPRVVRRASWWTLLVASAVASLAWSVALSASEGWRRVAEPLNTRYEYLGAVGQVGTPGAFLRTFVDRLAEYPTHVKGHPPGFVLVLWAIDRLGAQGPGWAAALVLAIAASGSAAVLIAVADVAGRQTARRIAPFLVLSPAAVWTATSGDAFFAGVAAAAVAVGIVASGQHRPPRLRWGLAVIAGLLFAGLALLSYGLVLLGLIPLFVAYRRHSLPTVVVTGAVALATLTTFGALTGFWWTEGIAATRVQQLAGVAPRRPWSYFVVGNLAALAVVIGPAALGGLALIRRNSANVLAAGAMAGVLVADLSGFSKGEVERIWLPFVPWLVVGVAALHHPRRWLIATGLAALGLQIGLRTPW